MPLHGPPSFDCYCGIYAVQTPEQAVPYLRLGVAYGHRPLQRIIGRVSLWGRIVEGEQGWRATNAYPEHLFVPVLGRRSRVIGWARPSPADVARALEEYGVPVELVPGSTSSRGSLVSVSPTS